MALKFTGSDRTEISEVLIALRSAVPSDSEETSYHPGLALDNPIVQKSIIVIQSFTPAYRTEQQ